MTVRPTESRLPDGMQPGDFGEAVMQGDYSLISYLTDVIPKGSFNEYVVMVINDAPADSYHWTFTDLYDDNKVVKEETTSTGVQYFEATRVTEVEIKVEIFVAAFVEPEITLVMRQWVLPRDGALEAMLTAEGAGKGTEETSREVVNELRDYIYQAAAATGAFGIPPRFLAAIVYKEALDRPKDPTGWRQLYNLADLANAPVVRSRELFLASEEINNANFANVLSVQEDNSLGVCQMKPQTLAMVLGMTEWLEIPKGKIKDIEKKAEENWSLLTNDQLIDLFNILRFPKSNIFHAAKLLTKLKNREVTGSPQPHRWPDLSPEQLLLPANEKAVKIIATEWNFGASKSPRDKVEANVYGGVKVLRILKMSILQHFFGTPRVTAQLTNIDGKVLAYLSADDHPYFGGITPIHGTITVEGEGDDKPTTIELEVYQKKLRVATARLATSASDVLLTSFGVLGKVEIGISQLVFELFGNDTTNIQKSRDSELMLRVRVRTQKGKEASVGYGPVELLVRYGDLRRIYPGGTNDTAAATTWGGDDWVLPNVKAVLADFPNLLIGDISRMNGGNFPPHTGHRDGNEVEAYFDGYAARNAATAQKLLIYLNDPLHGYKLGQVYVTYDRVNTNTFWTTIQNVVLRDTRNAADVITPRAGYEQFFHMRINA